MTIFQIKESLAEKHGFISWDGLMLNSHKYFIDLINNEAIELYAKSQWNAAIEAAKAIMPSDYATDLEYMEELEKLKK